MTIEERLAKLTPEHHHFLQVPDPWHISVLARLECFYRAFQERRVHQHGGDASLHAGPIDMIWYSVDVNGNLLQEWGFDEPLVVQ